MRKPKKRQTGKKSATSSRKWTLKTFGLQMSPGQEKQEDCERVMKKCRDGPALKNDIFITRDRTFNQRKEAKLFRTENLEREGGVTQPGGGGRGRGRGRPRGRGGAGRGGGGGGRGGRGADSESRKRQHSGDGRNTNDGNDDENKKRKTAGRGGANSSNSTPDQTRVPKPVSDHPPTPRSLPNSALGAVGGEENNF